MYSFRLYFYLISPIHVIKKVRIKSTMPIIFSLQFICPKCPKTFKMKKYLDNHLRIHLNLQPYRCKFCDRRFNDKSDMNWHELTHTGNYKHFCQYCQKGFAKPRLVLIHERQCKNKTHQPMDSD